MNGHSNCTFKVVVLKNLPLQIMINNVQQFTFITIVIFKSFARLVKLLNLWIEGSRKGDAGRQKKTVIGCSIWWVDQQIWFGYRDNIQKALWSLLHSCWYPHPLWVRMEHAQTITKPAAPCQILTTKTSALNLSSTAMLLLILYSCIKSIILCEKLCLLIIKHLSCRYVAPGITLWSIL